VIKPPVLSASPTSTLRKPRIRNLKLETPVRSNFGGPAHLAHGLSFYLGTASCRASELINIRIRPQQNIEARWQEKITEIPSQG